MSTRDDEVDLTLKVVYALKDAGDASSRCWDGGIGFCVTGRVLAAPALMLLALRRTPSSNKANPSNGNSKAAVRHF